MKKPPNKRADSSGPKPSWMGDYSIGQVSSFLQPGNAPQSKNAQSTNPALAAMFGKTNRPKSQQKMHKKEHRESGDGKPKKKTTFSKQHHMEGKKPAHLKKKQHATELPTSSKPDFNKASKSKHIHFGDDDGHHSNKKAHHNKKQHGDKTKPVHTGDGNAPEKRKKYKVKRNRKKGKGSGGGQNVASDSRSPAIDSVSKSIKAVNSPVPPANSQKSNKKNKNNKKKDSLEPRTDTSVVDKSKTDGQQTNFEKRKNQKPKKGAGDQITSQGDSKVKGENSVSGQVSKEPQSPSASGDSKKKKKRKNRLGNRRKKRKLADKNVNGETQSGQEPDVKKAKMSSDQSSEPADVNKAKKSSAQSSGPLDFKKAQHIGEKASAKRKGKNKKKSQQQQHHEGDDSMKAAEGKGGKPDSVPKETKKGKKRRRSSGKQSGDGIEIAERKQPSPSKTKHMPAAASDDSSDEEDVEHRSPKKPKRTDGKTKPDSRPSFQNVPATKKAKVTGKVGDQTKQQSRQQQQESESDGSESDESSNSDTNDNDEKQQESESDDSESDESSNSDASEQKSNSFRKNLLKMKSKVPKKQTKVDSDKPTKGDSKVQEQEDTDSSGSDSSEEESIDQRTVDDRKAQAIQKALAASRNLKAMELAAEEEHEDGTSSGSEDDSEDGDDQAKTQSSEDESSDDDDDDEDMKKYNDDMADEIDDILNDNADEKLPTLTTTSKKDVAKEDVAKEDVAKEDVAKEDVADNDAADPDGEQVTPSQPGKDDPKVLERTVFVGNLPTGSGKPEVHALFKKFGKIMSVRFRSGARADPKLPQKVAMITKDLHPERSSYNAYVVFKTAASAEKALAMNGRMHRGHHIRVDAADGSKQNDTKHSVFVGNLAFDMETEPLTRHFMQCDDVKNTRLVRDATTGLGKGFGYVQFKDSSSVELALKLSGSFLNGRNIRVNRALSKEKVQKIQQKKTRTVQKGGKPGAGGKPQRSKGPGKGGSSEGKGQQQQKRRFIDPKVLKKRQKRKRFKRKLKSKGKL